MDPLGRSSSRQRIPRPQGLYHPRQEHDACGVGFIANMHNQKSHDIIEKGIQAMGGADKVAKLKAEMDKAELSVEEAMDELKKSNNEPVEVETSVQVIFTLGG